MVVGLLDCCLPWTCEAGGPDTCDEAGPDDLVELDGLHDLDVLDNQIYCILGAVLIFLVLTYEDFSSSFSRQPS